MQFILLRTKVKFIKVGPSFTCVSDFSQMLCYVKLMVLNDVPVLYFGVLCSTKCPQTSQEAFAIPGHPFAPSEYQQF